MHLTYDSATDYNKVARIIVIHSDVTGNGFQHRVNLDYTVPYPAVVDDCVLSKEINAALE